MPRFIEALNTIDQSNQIYIAPYLASESEARVGGGYRRDVHVHFEQRQTVLSKFRLTVLKSLDLQLYDSEFQSEEALTQNAFADNNDCNAYSDANATQLSSCVASASEVCTQFATSSRLPTDSVDNLETGQTP